ncbi:hypothetical protein vseg_006806 [Gypsophila vaccaria]
MVDSHSRSQYAKTTHSDSELPSPIQDDSDYLGRESSFSAMGNSFIDDQPRMSTEMSPMMMSPWNQVTPFTKSQWSQQSENADEDPSQKSPLIGSLVREEGHIYSLATRGDLLYTGSDSKNIRVWKNLKEFSGFKSASGLVKAIVIAGGKIFTGHQDGKIRVWKVSPKNPSIHKRSGSLPTLKDIFKASMKPSNYVEVKKHKSSLWIKHSDAISCLSLNDEHGILYSASWDRTFKVWRISDSKCLESVAAHDDAVNSVVASSDGLIFTGSADGTVKVWRREMQGKGTKHFLMQTLLKQECAVTALAVDPTGAIVYCGSSDGLVNFWERDKNISHGGVLRGHKLAVLCLEAKARLVFSGSADKTICVWRRVGTTHTCLSMLTGHSGPVKCLAVEDDKEANGQKFVVYSGSLDKSVKVWSVSDQETMSPFGMNMMQQQYVMEMDNVPESLRSDSSS